MTGDRDTSARPRTVAAVLLCLVVLAVGAALAATSDPSSLDLAVALPVTLLPLVLVAAYVFTGRVTLDFEVRGNAHSVALGQLPLALGALLVAPLLHLAACLAATVALIALRRQYNLKGLYNLAVASFEVGAAAFAVSMVASSHDVVTRSLWLALLVGLLASDLVGPLLLGVVWWLLDMPQPWSQVLQPIVLGMTTSAAATALTVVAVSAAATEPAAVPLILVFAGGLAHAYRKYRRLRVQQATTQDLYAFVRDLGPLESDEDAALDVVEQVRLLLHAERLELLTTRNDGQWENLVAAESSAAARVPGEAPVAGRLRPEDSQRAGTATLACMTTPLFGSDGLLGLLTVKGRLGDVRSFDLGDFQLLEALGGELATALERGRLLAHLRRTATTDSLTGLPNLPEMSRLLDLQIAGAPELVVLAAVSVDSFREVNDTLGHAVGDALLLETAERLRRTHPAALIARIGGGRFAVAMPSVEGELSAHLFGLGIRALVEGEARIGAVGHAHPAVGRRCAGSRRRRGLEHPSATRRRRPCRAPRGARRSRWPWAPAYEVQGQTAARPS
jgi:GGDEF domain-containing protein